MATKAKATIVNENDADKIVKCRSAKKGSNPAEVKKTTLRDIGNRDRVKTGTDKPGIKQSKYVINIKNVKPRVDTHWKKVRSATKTTKNSLSVVSPKAEAKHVQNANVKNEQKPNVKNEQKRNVHVTKPLYNKATGMKAVTQKPVAAKLPVVGNEGRHLSGKSTPKLKTVISNNLEGEATAKTTTNSEPKSTSAASCSELLSKVENVDIDNAGNPLLVSEYVNDIYSYLYHLEIELSIEKNHLKHQMEVTPKMRAILIDWLVEVHYGFHLQTETFQMTVSIVDRYLQAFHNTPCQKLQLVGTTALYIAAKLEEVYIPNVADFALVTDNTYSKSEIFKMEKQIVNILKFNLNRPTSIHFLRRLHTVAKCTKSQYLMTKYFLELAATTYCLSHVKPSEIAAASLFLSLQLLNVSDTSSEELWTPTLMYYSHYTVDDLIPIIRKIALVVKNAPTSRLKAVYNKFQSRKFERIACHPKLSGPIIEKLCSE